VSAQPDVVESIAAVETVNAWLEALQAGLASRNADAIARLFADGGTFRDLLAVSWDIRHFVGSAEIGKRLAAEDRAASVHDLHARPTHDAVWTDDSGGSPAIMAFVRFRNDVGSGDGFVRLSRVEGSWVAAAMVLSLGELEGFPEQVGRRRPVGKRHEPLDDRPSWEDEHDSEFTDEDPQVVVVGAGHNGLMVAARMIRLGLSVLVVERNARVGDNWRNRYSALALHDPIEVDHLSYLPFPDSWPSFTPTRRFGDFLESYANLLDIPVWTSATVDNVHYEDDAQVWSVDVSRPGRETRTLRASHLVVTTGLNGKPRMPEVPGRSDFPGAVVHATDFGGGAEWRGKRAVVVGTGVSGHDVAQDLCENGAQVTMLQRGATYVINASTNHALSFGPYLEGRIATEDVDLMGQSMPISQYPTFAKARTQAAAERDREILDGLAAAGFRLSEGPDGMGLLGLVFIENKHGYYHNIGASQLIIAGRIAVRQAGIARFCRTGVVLDDGTELEADLVVFATGYESVNESNRALLGDIVDELPPIAKVGADGEFTAVARHSGKDRLWFIMTLGIPGGRVMSKLLGLRIRAIEAGLAPVATD
jgi:putative flavoprotein involved in K+ transport